jgi:hypothetical protein
VKRLLSPALILALLLLSIGCGDVFIRGAIETGSTIRGAVSIVRLDTDGTIQVTFVTLAQNGISSTIVFCGDQSALFPLDQTVLVRFNPGQPCATVIAVVIV